MFPPLQAPSPGAGRASGLIAQALRGAGQRLQPKPQAGLNPAEVQPVGELHQMLTLAQQYMSNERDPADAARMHAIAAELQALAAKDATD